MKLTFLEKTDPELAKLITLELNRQRDVLEMIPSENFTSLSVLEALGSVLTNKYSEGYPKKRYYGGNQFVDEVELLAQERAKKLFGVKHVNVQPYSGSPANFAVHMAVCKPGDTIMGLDLSCGGHLTHGWKVNASGIFFKNVPYHVTSNGYIDFTEIRELAVKHKPKVIWCGATAYVREFPFEELSKIADEVDAYFVADIAHIAGLIIAGVHTSPVPYAHIITTTVHKTLRGPRAGMIMVTEKGLKKDPELAEKIDKAVFPGLQGGPHDHTTAAIAVALGEALKPEFKEYGKQIVKNSKELAKELMKNGLKLCTNGTDNHMLLIDLTQFGFGKGILAQEALDLAGITVNKNSIPNDPSTLYFPSGLRLGTPALTTRGMKEKDMKIIANWIVVVIQEAMNYDFPENKDERITMLKTFRKEIPKNKKIKAIRDEVRKFVKNFPLYPELGD